MRFLVHEKSYETPRAAGSFRYTVGDTPLGITESWRITAVGDDHTIVRIDFDMRPVYGYTYLYHLILNADQQPDRLVYRLLDDTHRREVAGNLLFEEATVIHRQTIDDQTTTTEHPKQPLLIPTAVGLSLLALEQPPTALSLDRFAGDTAMTIAPVAITYQPQRTRNLIPVKAGATTFTTTTLGITWGKHSYQIWRDKSGYPVKLTQQDSFTAIDTRPVRIK